MAYRLKNGGRIVYGVGGRGMSRGVVGRAGQVFEEISNDPFPDFELVERNPDFDPDEDPPAAEWIVTANKPKREDPEVTLEVDEKQPDHGHRHDDDHAHEMTFDVLAGRRLQELVDAHALSVRGTGAQDKVVNSDMIRALKVEHGQA